MTANLTQINEEVWSRRRWLGTIAFVFFLQLGFIFLPTVRPPLLSQDTKPKPVFRLLTEPVGENELFDSLFASDPTLFVLPNRQGFSGAAWLKIKTMEYESPDWNEPVRWLAIDAEELGQTFVHSVQANRAANFQIAEKLPLQFETLNVPTAAGITDTTLPLQIEGELKQRPMLSVPELPTWSHTEPLESSVVQITVNGAGDVVTARLLSRSGLIAADQKALSAARTTQFQAANSGSAATNLTWGKLIFHWRTLPLVATNSLNGNFQSQ